jgi:hypothetical protein
MKKHLLPITMFFLTSLAFTTASFAEYRDGDSDYADSNGGSKWTSNIGCKIVSIPIPQKKVDILALEDNELRGYFEYGSGPDNDLNIYAEVYSDINWCGMSWRGERPPILHTKVIFKQNDHNYAEYIGEITAEYWSLNNGKFTFENGEVWNISDRQRTIEVPSSAKLKLKLESEKRKQEARIEDEKREQIERVEYEKRAKVEKIEHEKRDQIAKVEREKNEKIAKQKLAKFQKTLKSGSKVSFYVHGYKLGMVTSVKGDMVKIQVTTEIPLNARRLYNVRPYDEWVKKDDVNFPNAWSF